MYQKSSCILWIELGTDSIYIENAEKLGEELAIRNRTLIYGSSSWMYGCFG